MNKAYQLIIFDWDGTLMDSATRIVASFQASIAHVGLPQRTDEQVRHIIGLGMREAVESLFPGVAEADAQSVIEHYRYQYLEACDIPTPLFPGVSETIAQLRADGYLLAVATSKSRKGLNRAFAQSGLEAYFHTSRTADETRSKPEPLMLEEILSELQQTPQQALMIGDSSYDLEMANNASMHHIAVSYGAHDSERLLACGPQTCLHAINELLPWLQQQAAAA